MTDPISPKKIQKLRPFNLITPRRILLREGQNPSFDLEKKWGWNQQKKKK